MCCVGNSLQYGQSPFAFRCSFSASVSLPEALRRPVRFFCSVAEDVVDPFQVVFFVSERGVTVVGAI